MVLGNFKLIENVLRVGIRMILKGIDGKCILCNCCVLLWCKCVLLLIDNL